MPELADGQTVEIQGSAARPYLIKNVCGVYSCSCPAWRNQSLPIDRRSCKHLHGFLDVEAEKARVGATASPVVDRKAAKPIAPPLLLAETWTEETDPTGWFLSEKLDGVRAYWTGTEFRSRNGHPYHAPQWFTVGLPSIPLDGELWIDRKQFSRTVSIVRRQDGGDAWRRVRFMVFDAPQIDEPFESRLTQLQLLLASGLAPFASLLDQTTCRDRQHLSQELARVESLGGEGIMLRQPGSRYVPTRSSTLLKVKSFHDIEATVIGHQAGTGRHRGRLGALLVRLPNGGECAVGTGFTDAQRERPPTLGAVITLKYQEFTDAGIPRFPVFVRVRTDMAVLTVSPSKGSTPMSDQPNAQTRRFEFVQGTSSKFWEVRCDGNDVIVCFGRIGTTGQQVRKPFADAVKAEKHVEQLIRQKTGKGYVPAAV